MIHFQKMRYLDRDGVLRNYSEMLYAPDKIFLPALLCDLLAPIRERSTSEQSGNEFLARSADGCQWIGHGEDSRVYHRVLDEREVQNRYRLAGRDRESEG